MKETAEMKVAAAKLLTELFREKEFLKENPRLFEVAVDLAKTIC